MPEMSLPTLTAITNHQGVFGGHTVNGVLYELADGSSGWHMTTWEDASPVNVYWVANSKFYAAKIHLETEPVSEIRLEVFDEISYVVPTERSAVFEAIAAWGA